MTDYLFAEIENLKEAARESDRLLTKFMSEVDTESLNRHRRILAGIYRVTNGLQAVTAELEHLQALIDADAGIDFVVAGPTP